MDQRSAITSPSPSGLPLAAPPASMLWTRSNAPVAYPEAIAAMRDRIEQIRCGTGSATVWLLEHPPTFTAGTSAQAQDLFNPQGFPTYEAGRGGQWTYHGP